VDCNEQGLRFELDDLLAQITEENIHPEVDTGEPIGEEVL
jgi:antitoxin component of MazEF toxin-antitoxin module